MRKQNKKTPNCVFYPNRSINSNLNLAVASTIELENDNTTFALFSPTTTKMSYPIRLVSPVGNDDAYINVRWGDTDSTGNVVRTIKFACEMIPELRIVSQQTLFRSNIDLTDLTMVKAFAEAYNRLISDVLSRTAALLLQQMRNHSKRKSSLHPTRANRELLRFILKLCYEKENRSFLSQSHNEISFELIDELTPKFAIRSDDTFIHLGCGIGYVPLQLAAMVPCQKCIGIEKEPWSFHSAKMLEREFRLWMKWFGKIYSDFEIIEGDFFDENFRTTLKSGNVIFVNNNSFSIDKNHNLKVRFYDLQSGSRILSSKPFGEPTNRVTARNVNDIDSIMSLVMIDDLKTHWMSPFYLQTIDYSRIEQYFDGIARKRNAELTDTEENEILSPADGLKAPSVSERKQYERRQRKISFNDVPTASSARQRSRPKTSSKRKSNNKRKR